MSSSSFNYFKSSKTILFSTKLNISSIFLFIDLPDPNHPKNNFFCASEILSSWAGWLVLLTGQSFCDVIKRVWSFEHVCVIFFYKPLVAIWSEPLVQASPWLQRQLLWLQQCTITIHYLPGKYMYVAETLVSVFLTESPVSDRMDDDVEKIIHSCVDNLPMTTEKQEEMKLATSQDKVLQPLPKYVRNYHYKKVQAE